MEYAGLDNIRWMSGGLGVLATAALYVFSKEKINLRICTVIGGLVYALTMFFKTKVYPMAHEGAIAGAVVGAVGMVAALGLSTLASRLGIGPPTLEDMLVKDFRGMGMKQKEMRKIYREDRADPVNLSLHFFMLSQGAVLGLLGGLLGSFATNFSNMERPAVAPDSIAALPWHTVPALLVAIISFVGLVLLFGFMIHIIHASRGGGGCLAFLILLFLTPPFLLLTVLSLVGSIVGAINLGDHPHASLIKMICAGMGFIILLIAYEMRGLFLPSRKRRVRRRNS